MEEYKILIPSYKRQEKQTTLELLSGAYTKEDIIISTQTTSDYEAYKKAYGDRATIIYKEGNCVGDNRNNLLEYCCENNIWRCIMLDDDISGFLRYDNTKITQGKFVRSLFEYFLRSAENVGAKLFGTYPVANNFFMNDKVVRNILIGTCFGIMDTRLRFDRNFRIKEDYELCLRVMSLGGIAIRFNSYSPIAAHKSKGGCSDDWKSNQNDKYANILASAYPELCELNKKRKGEIIFKKRLWKKN